MLTEEQKKQWIHQIEEEEKEEWEQFYTGINREIRKIRVSKDIGVADLGNLADMDASHIYKIESNKKHTGLISLVRIARGLGVSVDDLLPIETESPEVRKIKSILNSCDREQLKEINKYLDERYGRKGE